MGTQIVLSNTNYSGFIADITFSAQTGGTISLGSHLTPYTVDLDYFYGTYELYYSAFNQSCYVSIVAPTPTPTPNPTPTPTPTFFSYRYNPSNGEFGVRCTTFSSITGYVNSSTPLTIGKYYCGAIPGYNSCVIIESVSADISYPFITLTEQGLDCRNCT